MRQPWFLLCLALGAVHALPSLAAPSTSIAPSGSDSPRSPAPTAPPGRPGLRTRDNPLLGDSNVDVEAQVCGWVSADPENAFSCVEKHATCFWDPAQKLVGCGNQASMPFVTSCIDYASAANCDSACAANPSNVVCASTAPFCRTVHFPDSFSMMPCGSVASPLTVNLTLPGLAGTVSGLPRFYTSAPNATAPPPPPTKYGGVNVGSIIAAAVGSAVLLAGLPFGIKMLLRKRKWRKAQRPRRLQEREMRRAWETEIDPRNEIPAASTGTNNFLFSQDWPGRAKTAGTAPATQQGNG